MSTFLPHLFPVVNRTNVTTTCAQRFCIANVQEQTIYYKDQQRRLKTLHDYLKRSTYMFSNLDGGPPRWFSPLECTACLKSPLLLALPGIDGSGLELCLNHQRLGEIFNIWCLHIPTTDRTPFTDLVKLVETTVRSEYFQFPNRPIYLVGESVGACLALGVAARTPDIDLVLVLANSATSFGKSRLQSLIPILKAMPDKLSLGLPYVLSLITGVSSTTMMPTAEKPVQDLSEEIVALFSYLYALDDVLTVELLLWKLKMLESAYVYSNSRIHNVTAQTLILSSGKDQLFPSIEEGQRLCRILHKCQIRTFHDCGHALFLEEDVDMVTIIKAAGFFRRSKHTDYALDFIPPTPLEFKYYMGDPLRWMNVATSPVMLSTLETGKIVRGLDGIPTEGPVLFVGYHNLLGIEAFLMMRNFLIERNIILRALAHPSFFYKLKEGRILPDLAAYDFLRIMGAVPVSASNMYKLFSLKSHVLLYPGGMREVCHKKGEEYKLFWSEQPEFVRAAALFGAKIIPFGTVGEDDFSELVLDYNDQIKIPFMRAYIEELRNEIVHVRTDAKGDVANQDVYFPGILPKVPGRFYYFFGKPIDMQGMEGELRNREKAEEMYLHVKSEVEKCLAYCKRRREEDPYRHIISRFMYQAIHGGFDSHVPTFHII
ncbi:phytyl ester synthase 2, chloroplastic-like [Rutidosis leptorrhynchoides]|uniref:phytyl ester synthase 2, chloroplastic-like n=1 Tax=Rutidosis leptorrhynchoides TaxID=125765 RepID=UPI003A99C017